MRAILILLATITIVAGQTFDTRLDQAKRAAFFRLVGDDFPTDGLMTYWSMDSRSGDDSTVFDTKGDNDGTQTGVAFGTDYGKYKDGAFWDSGLSGNRRIDVAYDASIDVTTDYTIAMWIKPEADGTVRYLMTRGDNVVSGQQKRYELVLNDANKLRWRTDGGSTVLSSATIASGSGWRHVAYVADSTAAQRVRIFLDGQDVTDTGASANPTLPHSGTTQGLKIGRNAIFLDSGSSGTYRGSLDEVAIWNRALSSNEVSEIYNNGVGRFYTP